MVVIACTCAISSCKKDQTKPILQIYAQDSGRTFTLSKGQSLKISLANPGDGGYNLDAPQYSPSVLKLNDHILIAPTRTDVIGDFGTDTWEFSALATGSSALTITATRPFDKNNPVVMFTGTIVVN